MELLLAAASDSYEQSYSALQPSYTQCLTRPTSVTMTVQCVESTMLYSDVLHSTTIESDF